MIKFLCMSNSGNLFGTTRLIIIKISKKEGTNMKLTKLLSAVLVVSILLCSLGLTAFATNTDETKPTLPTATVTEINNDDLTFALNFKADEVEPAQLEYYKKWYADFVLTVNKDVTFNANDSAADGYLSGQYDFDNWESDEEYTYDPALWINVPFENVTLEAGESLKIMEYASKALDNGDLKVTYKDVYTVVKDFYCGVYFNPKFLAENPDLEVNLELRMYNPANEAESYVIGRTYTFTAQQAEFTWYFDETTGKLTISGSGPMDDYSTTKPAPWKEYASQITEIEISEGITTIGRQAFKNLTALETLTLPDSIRKIGSYAFMNSTGIKTVNIAHVQEMGSNAFTGCDNLTTVNFTGSLAEYKALRTNVSSNILFLRATTTIKDNGVNSYAGMSVYTTWIYDSNKKTLELGICPGKDARDMLNYKTANDAPWSEYDIKKVIINDVTSVGSRSFYNNASLKDVKIGETVTAINTWAFYNNTDLVSVKLPASLTKIGTGAFYNVKSAVIESAATREEYEAITIGDSNLDFIRNTAILADSVKGWHSSKVNWYIDGTTLYLTGTGEMAAATQPWAEYADTITEVVIENGITSLGKQAFAGFVNVSEITLPESITSIKTYVFDGMTNLTTINIPASVTSIGTYAFRNCKNLTTVNYAGDLESLTIGSGNSALTKVLNK